MIRIILIAFCLSMFLVGVLSVAQGLEPEKISTYSAAFYQSDEIDSLEASDGSMLRK